MVVWCTQNLRRDGSSFMWHQPCQRCKRHTTSVALFKTRYKKLVTHVESHASAVSLQESGEQRYIIAIIIIIIIIIQISCDYNEDHKHEVLYNQH